MKLRTVPAHLNLYGKRVLVRVDWNVPLRGKGTPEDSLKVKRSLRTLDFLQKRGAITILLTHIGRPKGREKRYSTAPLGKLLKKDYRRTVHFHGERVSNARERVRLQKELAVAKPGSFHLLENVRFEQGEEKNDEKLARAYAELGDVFINDAFASSHRAHVSVVGIARFLSSYAGHGFVEEVSHLSRLLRAPRRPFIAIIGGLKLSTKIPVVVSLLKTCDRVFLGGALAMTVLAGRGISIGRTPTDAVASNVLSKLIRSSRLVLPEDVIVTRHLSRHALWRSVSIQNIGDKDLAVDLGPKTIAAWKREIERAQTILWNGPVGVEEVPAFAHGSRMLARAIGLRSRGRAFGVAGGGDTIPVVLSTPGARGVDFLSTGGGALLEFLAKKGKLPGLKPLMVM